VTTLESRIQDIIDRFVRDAMAAVWNAPFYELCSTPAPTAAKRAPRRRTLPPRPDPSPDEPGDETTVTDPGALLALAELPRHTDHETTAPAVAHPRTRILRATLLRARRPKAFDHPSA
jgi:hypothetical protein